MASQKTVTLKGDPIVDDTKSVKTGNTVTPGMLVDVDSADTVIPHGTAGGTAAARFALERSGVGKDLDDNYAALDLCKMGVFPPGSRVNALVAAGAPAIVIGDKIESAGNGTVRKHVPQTDTDGTGSPAIRVGQIIGQAREAVDNSGGGSSVRIDIEIL